MKNLRLPGLSALATVALLAFSGCQSDDHAHMNHSASMDGAKPYTSDKCIVSGDPIDPAKPVSFVYNGQQIKLCCNDCKKDFDKDPAKYMAKLNSTK
jgi:YHS domain-containing protein